MTQHETDTPSPETQTMGIELAARFLEKRLKDYVDEFGSTDPETGTVEFPGNGDEYVGELEEIIDGIRALPHQPVDQPHQGKDAEQRQPENEGQQVVCGTLSVRATTDNCQNGDHNDHGSSKFQVFHDAPSGGVYADRAAAGAAYRRGDWMQTVSGRQFWPLDPHPEDIFIEDIAHALSMMCRFGGHCERFYSVAEHSVLVSENVPATDAMWALLHDASEAYIADIVRPAKRFIDGYKQIEHKIMGAVCDAFDIPHAEPPSVKRTDNAILADEAAQIMGTKPKDWILPEPPLGVRIVGLSPADAKAAFLARYHALATEGSVK